jgi:hypothetical protein
MNTGSTLTATKGSDVFLGVWQCADSSKSYTAAELLGEKSYILDRLADEFEAWVDFAYESILDWERDNPA